MTKISEITSFLENQAPLDLQESYDNSGLLVGNPENKVTEVLLTLDCTEDVLDEAIRKKCNLVIAHHPIIFKGIKSLTGKNYVERTVIKAIREKIAIYAIHTNLDNVRTGVNAKIAELLELEETSILKPAKGNLLKLVTFVPHNNRLQVLNQLFEAGAGDIGNYSGCSFSVLGQGTFYPNENAHPTIGEKGKHEEVEEARIEVILSETNKFRVFDALKRSHPYEEVAYYLSRLENPDTSVGSGLIGKLGHSLSQDQFLRHLRDHLNISVIRFTPVERKINKVAVCGGSGSFMIPHAKRQQADALVTSDVKYHEFFDAEQQLLICDVGHFESEVFTKDLLQKMLNEKFTNFAVNLSETDTNPIRYFT